MKVSINIINYNEIQRGRFDNFWSTCHRLREINAETEIVVVDGYSTDGSFEKLKQIADVIEQQEPCKGRQRQRALELCSGDYIIDLVDTDQIILPDFVRVVNRYLELKPPYALNTDGCMISRRGMIREWPPLCKAPDKPVWYYLATNNMLRFLPVNTVDHVPSTAGKVGSWIQRRNQISEEEFFGGGK